MKSDLCHFTDLHRRAFVKNGALLALAGLLPPSLMAAVKDLPRSPFGAGTTADEVLEGLDLSGKTALITGVNSGIGYESMRALAAHGVHVIGAARTEEKARKACDSVEGRTTPVVCELTDFGSVVACVETVQDMNTPIDILMCNAGVMALPELEQVYGLEKQFVINYLGHYLLTRRLLEQVEAAPEARIVTLSSIAYKYAPKAGIEFDNLSGNKGYQPMKAYGQSKLADALFAFELARRYEGTNVAANTVHPGMVATNLGRYFMKKPRDPNAPLRRGFKTADQGAATQVYVASSPALKGVSGYYFEDCNPVEPEGPHMSDADMAKKLWQVSEDLTRSWLS